LITRAIIPLEPCWYIPPDTPMINPSTSWPLDTYHIHYPSSIVHVPVYVPILESIADSPLMPPPPLNFPLQHQSIVSSRRTRKTFFWKTHCFGITATQLCWLRGGYIVVFVW